MPANKNVTAGGGDSSGEDEISVDKVVETKRELDKVPPNQCLVSISVL